MAILSPVIEPPPDILFVLVANDFHGSFVRAKPVCDDNFWVAVSLHCLTQKFQCRMAIPALGDIGFQHFTFMINRPPKVMDLPVDTDKNLVQMPLPLRPCPKPIGTVPSDLSEATTQPELPLFGPRPDNDAEDFYGKEVFNSLPVRARKAAADALELYRFFGKKTEAPNFAPVIQALLGSFDEACKAIIVNRLQSSMPATAVEQRDWFDPYMPSMDKGKLGHLNGMAKNLKRGLVYGNPHSVIGLLRSCLDFALNDTTKIEGVFKEVNTAFRFEGSRALFEKISAVNEFRNTYVAHSQKELRDAKLAEQNLKSWIVGLSVVASR